MGTPLKLWTNLWSPWERMESEAAGAFLSEEQLQSLDAIFGEAIKTTEGKFAIALGRSAQKMATNLYIYYEPLAYLVVVLDPFKKKVAVSANSHYWPALERQLMDLMQKAETLLGEERFVEAVGLCIREGRVCVESLMKLGPP